MTTHGHSDDFDIAKGIFDQLKDLPTERQQRVLRWIAEGLGVAPGSPAAPVHGVGTPTLPALPPSPATVVAGTGDIKTFVAAKAPKSDMQFAATVAYFYRFEAPPAQRRDAIDGDALQEAARLAGRKRLANPRATLNNAKAAGYLDGVARGEFTINSVGENLVAMTLPGVADAPSKGKSRAKGRGKKKSTPRKR
jgi:hypothetical protein